MEGLKIYKTSYEKDLWAQGYLLHKPIGKKQNQLYSEYLQTKDENKLYQIWKKQYIWQKHKIQKAVTSITSNSK